MPDGWELGLFIHIIAVFALGGAIAVSFATYSMMRRAGTVQEIRVWAGLGRILSEFYVFPVTALVLLLSGAYLMDKFDAAYDWTDGWVLFSLLALLVAVAVGGFVITPGMKAIGMKAGPSPDGPVPQEITRMLNEPMLFAATHMNMMIAIGIIWNMAVKPGDLQALLVLVVLAAVGAGAAYPRMQAQRG